MPPQLVVGFDLDLTLLDSRGGIAATLHALDDELGLGLPLDDVDPWIGPPIWEMLEPYVAPDRIDEAVARYRALYPELAIESSPAMPGALEAVEAVRRHGGKVLVVTGKHVPSARAHLAHLGIEADLLVGEVFGHDKGAPLRTHGATVYVGDHVLDVEGARAAGAVSVSVPATAFTPQQLREAGTDVLLGSLEEFPRWLDEHVLQTRMQALEHDLRQRGSLLVAYSGGADSAFLLAAAARISGPENVVAATGYSHSLPNSERDPAADLARQLNVKLVTPQTHEIERPGYRANGRDRCFFCKAELIETLTPLARELGIAYVATGTNADDAVEGLAGLRPGIRAAQERGAITPLRDAGLTKSQIRAMSRRWGLPTWDKPAAACLSSRISYGLEVTPQRLARVERAEAGVRAVLAAHGHDAARLDLRVRDRGEKATVELSDTLLPLDQRLNDEVIRTVISAGFPEAEVDPRGFRSGSLNEPATSPSEPTR